MWDMPSPSERAVFPTWHSSKFTGARAIYQSGDWGGELFGDRGWRRAKLWTDLPYTNLVM